MRERITSFEARDDFNRKPIAEQIIKIIQSKDVNISPLMIDGKWGTGKSEFCQKLIDLINNGSDSKLQAIYIDSYLYDYCDDPLLMILSQISNSLQSNDPKKKELIARSVSVLKVMGKTLLKGGITWGLKVNADTFTEEIVDAASGVTSDLVDDGLKEMFKDFEKIEKNIESLKGVLNDISKEKEVIIVIDELDRCKPSFALSLLEKVKHVFDIPNIKFIFASNSEQIYAIIKKQYGQDVDSELYLKKFFALTIKLPEYKDGHRTLDSYAYLYFRSEMSQLKPFDKFFTLNSFVDNFFKDFFKKDERSLRDSENFIDGLKVLYALDGKYCVHSKTHYFYSLLYMLGTYIYLFNSDKRDKFLSQKVYKKDIEDIFDRTVDSLKSFNNTVVEIVFVFLLGGCSDVNLANHMDNDVFKGLDKKFSEVFFGVLEPSKIERLDVIRNVMTQLQFIWSRN